MTEIPDWLAKALKEAEAEGRIIRDTAVRADAVPEGRMVGESLLDGASEADFEQWFLAYAQGRGWKAAHFRPARVLGDDGQARWCTPVGGDGKGFLDWELARERLVKVELKVEPNKMTPEQQAWFDLYARIGVEVYCWYPSDWPEIKRVMR